MPSCSTFHPCTAIALAGAKACFAISAAAATMSGLAADALPRTVEIRMAQTPAGTTSFEPIGVHIAPGDTVRWVQVSGYHSVAAYHPGNGNHELRIPESAEPWNSDILLAHHPDKGSTFEHVFTVPGVYDYFCDPHEMAGMVGRIVVGVPGEGPGTRPFGYAPAQNWKPVPEVARQALPSVDRIMGNGILRMQAGGAP